MGYKVRELGEKLERKVVSLLTSKGYKCEKNVRRRGAEFDVICFKKGGIFSDDEWIFVECKNKEKVIPADFKKFLGNFEIFCSEEKLDKNKVEGIRDTTGVFDPEVKRQAREISNIKLKRIKLT
jgi:Holliday junction resolvase-like predicted endonuclease